MANINSQIKRNRRTPNGVCATAICRGAARTSLNQARAAVTKNAPESKEAVMAAISELDQAPGKGVIHKNNAARLKSRLMKKLASLGAAGAPKTAEK